MITLSRIWSNATIGSSVVDYMHSERAEWCEPLCVQRRAFPREQQPEKHSRASRLISVTDPGCVCTYELRLWRNAGGTAEDFLRPDYGMEDYFLYNYRKEIIDMKGQLEQIKQQATELLNAATTPAELEELRVRFLGKKGELTAVLKLMGKLSPEERPVMGQIANSVRNEIEEKLEARKASINASVLETKLKDEAIDVTIPGTPAEMGHEHPMNKVLQEIKDLFVGLGYQIVDGPEVELADYNFTRLNIEEGHPSRDRSDTFYFTDDDGVLLRTQTSPMQIRVMENAKPPICILAPGRVYRKDEADATHSPMFHQIEGLVVDENITMGDLKGALVTLMKSLYGEDAVMRFRPHHFPFTEPSCEMDMQCHKCHGTGEVDGNVCSTCHGEGWIELLGAGMVHPAVLEGCGIDPEKYSGFAFGMGLERMAMRRTRINDLRLIFDNDIRFLNQF